MVALGRARRCIDRCASIGQSRARNGLGLGLRFDPIQQASRAFGGRGRAVVVVIVVAVLLVEVAMEAAVGRGSSSSPW